MTYNNKPSMGNEDQLAEVDQGDSFVLVMTVAGCEFQDHG